MKKLSIIFVSLVIFGLLQTLSLQGAPDEFPKNTTKGKNWWQSKFERFLTAEESFFTNMFKEGHPEVSLRKILDKPESHKELPVIFQARFNEIGDFFNTAYTTFNSTEHINLSLFQPEAKIWGGEKLKKGEVVPYFFAGKISSRGKRFQSVVQSLNRFEKVRIFGVVRSVFADRPYIEIVGLERLEADEEPVTELGLTFMSMGDKAVDDANDQKGDWRDAEKNYLKAIESGLCREYEGICYLRAGQANYKLKNYKRAKELLEEAEKRIPEEPDLLPTLTLVKKLLKEEMGSTETKPEVVPDTKKLDELQNELRKANKDKEDLKNEIAELSQQKIDWLAREQQLLKDIERLKEDMKNK